MFSQQLHECLASGGSSTFRVNTMLSTVMINDEPDAQEGYTKRQ